MEKLIEIKSAIENGSKFNGIVYGKDNGRNWTTLFIYLDGKFTKIQEVAKTSASAKKDEFTTFLNTSSKSAVVDFGTTYERFGLDVAVGEAE